MGIPKKPTLPIAAPIVSTLYLQSSNFFLSMSHITPMNTDCNTKVMTKNNPISPKVGQLNSILRKEFIIMHGPQIYTRTTDNVER